MSAIERIAQIFEGVLDEHNAFLSVSDVEHKWIHAGLGYGLIGNTGALSSGSSYYVSIHTPVATAKRFVHIRPAILASTANILKVDLLEGAAFTAGTAANGFNMNRNYPDGPTGFITVNATSVSGGTTIYQDVVGSTSTAGTGGSRSSFIERVLKPDTNYVIKFTNAGATTDTTGYFTLFWYVVSEE